MLIMVLIAPWLAPAGKVSAGGSSPVPGKNGLITVKLTDDNNIEVRWGAGFSDTTETRNLKYQVFVSNTSNLNNMTEIRDNLEYGDEDWVLGSTSNDDTFFKIFQGLDTSQTLYYNVMVVDRYDLEAAYQMKSFNPNTQLSPLEQFNDVKERKVLDNYTDFIPEVMELFSNKDFLADPDFESLSEDEQYEIAEYMLKESSPPASSRYESKEQVQYVVQLALQARNLPREIGGLDSREVLDAFFNKQAERLQLQFHNQEEDNEYYERIHYYLDSSEIERRMAAFRYEGKLTRNLDISQILDYTKSALEDTPFINKVTTVEEMVNKLINMLEIQEDIESYNSKEENQEKPLGKFPLDVSKLNDLTSEEQEELAEYMLSERPLGGYASFEEIQTAFNKFFPDDNESDPLSVLNTAKSNSNIAAMRMAMEDPDLGITLPNGYGALSLQVRDFIAGFLIEYVNKDYKNKEQVQYMIELGVLAQSVWGQRELSVLRNKLDLLAQQLVNGPNHFNDQQTYVLRSLGQQHLERSKVDKGVLAFNYLHLVAFERLEGMSKGDIVDPDIVLNLLSMPIDSFEQATSIPRMDQWLDKAMKDQIKGEAFFSKYKFNLRGALDLSKRAELSPEGQKELAEWVLNEQDRYEDVGNLQNVFNRFFTAPNVKGNDINNT